MNQPILAFDLEARSRQLPEDRQELLCRAADQMFDLVSAGSTVNLLFVCTHNSRRSQLCEVWANVACSRYAVSLVQCFSCGTEVTECNPRTVESLRRTGFVVESDGAGENPKYTCQPPEGPAVVLYSKAFGDATLPTKDVAAMMCCDDADANCPVIPGAKFRVALHYQDPKSSDGTALEPETYDERSRQIGAEMFYLMRQVAAKSGQG